MEVNLLDWNKVKNKRYLIRHDNTIYTIVIKLYFWSISLDKAKVQKQIRKLLIIIERVAQLKTVLGPEIFLLPKHHDLKGKTFHKIQT